MGVFPALKVRFCQGLCQVLPFITHCANFKKYFFDYQSQKFNLWPSHHLSEEVRLIAALSPKPGNAKYYSDVTELELPQKEICSDLGRVEGDLQLRETA